MATELSLEFKVGFRVRLLVWAVFTLSVRFYAYGSGDVDSSGNSPVLLEIFKIIIHGDGTSIFDCGLRGNFGTVLGSVVAFFGYAVA